MDSPISLPFFALLRQWQKEQKLSPIVADSAAPLPTAGCNTGEEIFRNVFKCNRFGKFEQ